MAAEGTLYHYLSVQMPVFYRFEQEFEWPQMTRFSINHLTKDFSDLLCLIQPSKPS
jgi:hypothetical protein